MPVFRVRGTSRWGERFRVRLEAPSETAARAALTAEAAQVEAVARLPLTWWPFSRLPWMILVFPILCYGVYWSGVLGVRAALDLGREAANRAAYERLAREGGRTAGTVTAAARRAQRGLPGPNLEYRFVAPDGRERRGQLAPGAGDVAQGRHDLRLLAAPVEPGATLTVTFVAAKPTLHAPFPVDAALLARFDRLGAELRLLLARLAAVALGLSWMVWNVLVRTGGHLVLSERQPRIVLIAAGENPLVPPDGEEDEEDEEEEGA